MQITVLNGAPTPGAFDDYLNELTAGLQAQGHAVTLMTLRELQIRTCVGCFGCWVKTPGECVFLDESAGVCWAVINSDLTLMASPLKMGFVSAELKKVVDKLIPLVMPYTTLVAGEVHHTQRYQHYPRLALLLDQTAGHDDEDVAITRQIFNRTALNLKTDLAFCALAQQPVEEVLHEIDAL